MKSKCISTTIVNWSSIKLATIPFQNDLRRLDIVGSLGRGEDMKAVADRWRMEKR